MEENKKEKYSQIMNGSIDDALEKYEGVGRDYKDPVMERIALTRKGETAVHELGPGEPYHKNSDSGTIPLRNAYPKETKIAEAPRGSGLTLDSLFNQIRHGMDEPKRRRAVSAIIVVIALSVFSLGFIPSQGISGNAISVTAYSFYHVVLSLALLAVAALIFVAARNDGIKFFYK